MGKDRTIKENATLPIPSNYTPTSDFILDALQYTKVKCTWDDDDITRKFKLSNSASNNIDDDSISSSEKISSKGNKFRKLLGLSIDSDDDESNDNDDESSSSNQEEEEEEIKAKKRI